MSENFINTPFMQTLYWQVVNELKNKTYQKLFSFNNQYSLEVAESLQIQLISLLLESGQLTINNRDRNGQTLLMWASESGHEAIVSMLLQQNAIINMKDYNDETALYKAVAKNHPVIVNILLSNDADLGTANWAARTPLEEAINEHCESNVDNLITIEHLLKKHIKSGITDDKSDLFRDDLLTMVICAKKYDLYYLIAQYRQRARPDLDTLSVYFSNPLLPDDSEFIDYLFKRDPDSVLRHKDKLFSTTMSDNFPNMNEQILKYVSPSVVALPAWNLSVSRSMGLRSSGIEIPVRNVGSGYDEPKMKC